MAYKRRYTATGNENIPEPKQVVTQTEVKKDEASEQKPSIDKYGRVRKGGKHGL